MCTAMTLQRQNVGKTSELTLDILFVTLMDKLYDSDCTSEKNSTFEQNWGQ